jgi:hypothetical protein
MGCGSIASKGRKGKKTLLMYSGWQKNIPVFKRFFSTTTYAAIRNIIMKSGINAKNE